MRVTDRICNFTISQLKVISTSQGQDYQEIEPTSHIVYLTFINLKF